MKYGLQNVCVCLKTTLCMQKPLSVNVSFTGKHWCCSRAYGVVRVMQQPPRALFAALRRLKWICVQQPPRALFAALRRLKWICVQCPFRNVIHTQRRVFRAGF
jgi:hypothetical protein